MVNNMNDICAQVLDLAKRQLGYKEEGNNDGAMKVATSYMKNRKNDYNAYLLMAEGYLLNNNLEKGKEMINTALDLTKDSANILLT